MPALLNKEAGFIDGTEMRKVGWSMEIISYLLLEGEGGLLHFFETEDSSVKALIFLLDRSHFHQPTLFIFPNLFHPFNFQLLLIACLSMILPLIFVVGSS